MTAAPAQTHPRSPEMTDHPLPETLRPDIEAAIRDQLAPRPDTTDLIAWIVAQTRKETRA